MSQQTYAELIRSGALKLREAGLESAAGDARRLMLLATEFSSAALISAENDKAADNHRVRFEAFVQRRANRVPFAHISGWAEFYGLSLRSDQRALIPRPDSETVVALALELLPTDTPWQIADLGAGSGALLAAMLHERSHTRGYAVEASPQALSLAAENFETLGVADRVQTFLGSWRDWRDWSACDLIISNPPYILSQVIAELEPEVSGHDPLEALDGGTDGLDAYREIVALGKDEMKAGAHLVLEIGYDQKDAVSSLLLEYAFRDLQHRLDLGGNDRAIAATKS